MRTPTPHRHWGGASHSRMTPSMDYLPLPAYRMLSFLRRIIPDNATRVISQIAIAHGANVGESTVSKYMPLLVADGWVERSERQSTGRGHGYAITVLPPPELLRAEALRTSKGSRPSVDIVAPAKGSRGEDDDDPSFAAPRTEYPDSEGSRGERPNNIDHDHQNQQQQAPPDSDLLQELAGDDPQVVIEVIRLNPGMTAADFHAAVADATRPNVHNPRGLALYCLSRGLAITPVRRAPPVGTRGRAVPWDTPDDLATYYAAAVHDQRAAASGDVRQPDDATPDELAAWNTWIALGDTPEQVLDRLLTRRYQVAHLPTVQPEARYARH